MENHPTVRWKSTSGRSTARPGPPGRRSHPLADGRREAARPVRPAGSPRSRPATRGARCRSARSARASARRQPGQITGVRWTGDSGPASAPSVPRRRASSPTVQDRRGGRQAPRNAATTSRQLVVAGSSAMSLPASRWPNAVNKSVTSTSREVWSSTIPCTVSTRNRGSPLASTTYVAVSGRRQILSRHFSETMA